jgi:sigma-E factor negative regulatory protein RseA
MNDRMNESLSALVDGEADELEIRRVLNELEQDDELRQRWNRYQMMGALMRGEPATRVDLSKGIMQALDGEPMDEVPGVNSFSAAGDINQSAIAAGSSRFRSSWVASGAVAASVAFAVLLGARFFETPETANGAPAVAAIDLNTAAPQLTAVVNPEPVSTVVNLASADVEPVLDEEQLRAAQQRLHDYVMQHSQHAGLNNGSGLLPFARVTSYEQGGEQQQ